MATTSTTTPTVPTHLATRPAVLALYAAAQAKATAEEIIGYQYQPNGRTDYRVVGTFAEGVRRCLDAATALSYVDEDPGELGAIAAGFGFIWYPDDERFTCPSLDRY